MRARRPWLSTVCASLCAAAPLHAQGTIDTDRPGFLFTSTTVAEGTLQLEAGTPLWFSDDEDGVETDLATLPLSLRYGLSDSFELRLGSGTTYNWLDTSLGNERGWGDLEAGFKLGLSPSLGQDSAALIASVRLPTGDDAFTVDDPAPSLFAVSSWTAGEDVLLRGMLGVSWTPIDHDDDAVVGTVAGLVGKPLGGGWTGYAEAAWLPKIENAVDTAYAGLTTTKLLTDDLQLDVSIHRGLTDESSDWLFGVGISFRF